jgi:hypothetical protein
MNRRKSAVTGLISAVIAGLLVYGVYWLLIKQVELQKTVQVIAPKTLIPAGTLIQADMLEYKQVLVGAYEADMMTELVDVVGTEPYIPLGSKEPILRWKLDKLRLMPGPDQSTFQIPREYILSLSNGIRAGDRVRIYVSGADGESRRLLTDDITVASVKSANNVEVDHPVQSNFSSALRGDEFRMYASRREASGSIDQINLNLTEEEWLKIDYACKDKAAKLVIALTPLSLPAVP